MAAVATDNLMAKKTNTTPVKMPADVIESARIVSALAGVTMMDLMGEILRPRLAEMERELLAQRSRAIEGADADPAESSPSRRRGRSPKGGGR